MAATNRPIEEIEAELRAARQAEADRVAAENAKYAPIYKYTIEPHDDQFDRIFDDTIKLYRISGICTNRDEAEAHGHRPFAGSMNYAYNTVTKKIIMAVGGGTIFISNSYYSKEDFATEAMTKVSEFVAANPDGGDITSIVVSHRKAIEAANAAYKSVKSAPRTWTAED